jgi:hypothetical protein
MAHDGVTGMLNAGILPALQLGGHFEEVRELASVIALEPFNSAKKRMGVTVKVR